MALSGCQAGNTNPVTLDAAPVLDAPTQNSSIVRVLTHNIGPWADARENALALFASEEFDIIALQEVTRNTDATSSLLAQNPALSYEDNGTTNPIFWRTSVFSWDSSDTGIFEWPVPDGAIGGNRTANWVRLHHLASERDLLVVSTQLLSLAGQVENAEALTRRWPSRWETRSRLWRQPMRQLLSWET
ncbi:MAG: hypothetical protein JKY56_19180 [Kofleriaceae bacterium]|nr:hypothetical protein [Kofleriaceae bacterium]